MGLFVEAEILGRVVENAVVLPRAALRDANQVLVADGEDRLRIRRVEVLRSSRGEVVLRSGLVPGDRVVISSLEAPVDGMPVRSVSVEWRGQARGPEPALAARREVAP